MRTPVDERLPLPALGLLPQDYVLSEQLHVVREGSGLSEADVASATPLSRRMRGVLGVHPQTMLLFPLSPRRPRDPRGPLDRLAQPPNVEE